MANKASSRSSLAAKIALMQGDKKPKANKFGAVPVIHDGIKFASTKEGNRYLALKTMIRAGVISDLRMQVKYPLIPYQKFSDDTYMKSTSYYADFVYTDTATGLEVVEDAKGMKTDVYQIKRKLMKLLKNIEVYET